LNGFLVSKLDVAGVDGVWVLWGPDQLTAWSVQGHAWSQMIFSGVDPDAPGSENQNLALLQEIELRFLELAGHSGVTPYLFEVRSASDHGSVSDDDDS
jgi:hypothetical protein